MNNATLEHLLKIAAPPRDAGPAANRARGDATPFDSLFRQASQPPVRTKSASGPSSTSLPAPESRSTNSQPAPAKHESTKPQDSAQNSESEYAAASSTAEENRDEPALDERDSTAVPVVAAVAPPTTAPADEAAAEVALVGEVEQAIDASAEAGAESNKKSATKAIPVTAPHADAPIDETVALAEPTEVTDETGATATTDAVVAVEAETHDTLKPEIAAAAQPAVTSAPVETKDQPRTAAKKRADNRDAGPTQSVDANSAPAAEQSAKLEAADPAIDPQSSFETAAPASAPQDTEPKPAATRNDLQTNDQPAVTNANRDGAPAPIRPAAVTSAPLAANVQQQSQTADAATSNVAATDAKSNTAAVRTKDSPLSPFARLERNQTGSSRGTQAGASGNATHHVDPARFVSRVARAIHTAQERGGPLQIRLSPPELGAMRMELSVKQGTLTATIETDNTAARQALLENLPALRERLAEQNVKIERFDVDVRRDGSGQQNSAAQQQHDDAQQARAAARGASLGNAPRQTTGDEPTPIRRTITSSSINVIA